MKAVIFDMDGVIIDSEKLHQKAEIEAMAAHGLPITIEDIKPFAGASRAAFKVGFNEIFQREIDWDPIFVIKDRLFTELMQQVDALPGVLDVISGLNGRGVKLAIATSSQRYVLDFVVERFGLRQWFQEMVCGNDISKSKPDPEIFLKAAEKLGVDPADCAAFEDSLNGLRSAKAAGMHAIGITTTFRADEMSIADHVIDTFVGFSIDDLLEAPAARS